MLRPLRLLNLALGLVAVMLVAALAKTWVAPAILVPAPPASKPAQEAPVLAAAPTARPPLTHFDVLLQKNPFKQPAPPPARSMIPTPAPPPPPPLPLPTLVGTVLVDDERRAILSDKGKANIYSIGQEVAGGTVTSISEDRVAFKRGEVVSEITLKAPIQPGGPTPAPPGPPPPGPAPASMPPPAPPQAIEGAPTPPAEAPTRTERRRPRLLRQPGQVVLPSLQEEGE